MNRTLLSILLFLGMASAALAQNSPGSLPLATTSAAINVTSATTTKLITADSRSYIWTYVTAFNLISNGTGTVQFEYGTGTLCATGTVLLTGAYPLTAQTGLAPGNGSGAIHTIPPLSDVCVVTTASATAQGSISFAQY